MSERLGEEIIRHYDAGVWAFAAKAAPEYANLVSQVNLDELMATPQPQQAIQALSPQSLYWAMHAKGLEECADVLALTSADQFRRIFDYSTWLKNELQPRLVFGWLKLCKHKSPQVMLQKFRELDEEYQIACLEPYIRIYSAEDVERMSESQQDQLLSLPNNALYYTIDTADQELFESIESLLETATGQDIEYTFQLLASAAYTPPHEQELLLQQFRNARLTEDGFVTPEEAQLLTRPVAVDSSSVRAYLQEQYFALENPRPAAEQTPAPRPAAEGAEESFLLRTLRHGIEQQILGGEVYAEIHKGMLHLTNGLSVLTGAEPGSIRSLLHLLTLVDAGLSLTLEVRSHGQLERAAELLATEHVQTLYRQSFSFAAQLRAQVITRLEMGTSPLAAKLSSYSSRGRYGALLDYLDKQVGQGLDAKLGEHLKALFNRFPAVAIAVTDDSGQPSNRYQFQALRCAQHLIQLSHQLDTLLDENLDPQRTRGYSYSGTFFDAFLNGDVLTKTQPTTDGEPTHV